MDIQIHKRLNHIRTSILFLIYLCILTCSKIPMQVYEGRKNGQIDPLQHKYAIHNKCQFFFLKITKNKYCNIATIPSTSSNCIHICRVACKFTRPIVCILDSYIKSFTFCKIHYGKPKWTKTGYLVIIFIHLVILPIHLVILQIPLISDINKLISNITNSISNINNWINNITNSFSNISNFSNNITKYLWISNIN